MSRFRAFLACLLCASALCAETVSLDSAISALAGEISSLLPERAKIAVIKVESGEAGGAGNTDGPGRDKLADYILEELTASFVNGGRLVVIERKGLGDVNDELALQLSGNVDDESAQSIGRILGAEVIVTGSFDEAYRLRVKAVSVESARILAVAARDVARGGKADALIGRGKASLPAGYDASAGRDPDGNPVRGFADPEAWFTFADSSGSEDSLVFLSTEWETIQGKQYLVVSVEAEIPSKFSFAWAGWAAIPDFRTLSDLQAANGIKFKIIGDGHAYDFRVETSGVTDGNWHRMGFETKKGQVIEVSIPYRKLRQEVGKTVRFRKNEITGISFLAKRSTASPLKIFDVRPY